MATRIGTWPTAVLVVFLLVGSASGEIQLSYLGAFKTGLSSVYYGDIAYYPAGNGGAGSFFLTGSNTAVRQVSVPALVNSTNINALNTATQLSSFNMTFTTGVSLCAGLAYRSTDNKLYCSYDTAGSASYFWSINPDGTSQAATQTIAWARTGTGLFQVPDAWADSYTGGRNLLATGTSGNYGIRITAVDPYNTPISNKSLVAYDAQHLIAGYASADLYDGGAWVSAGGDADIIVSGKVSATNQATFWFYKASDIATATQTYQPQPYKTLSVDANLFDGGHRIYGLTFDAAHQVLYGYEGAWQAPTVVHAWAVTPEPVSVFLAVMGLGVMAIRRR